MATPGITTAFDTVTEKVRHAALFVTGKETAMNMGAAATGLGGAGVAVVTIGLTASVSAGLTQMDYNHKRRRLQEFYSEEIAAKLHKPIETVTREDMVAISGENKTIAGALNKARNERNFGVVFSVLASVAALTVVAAVAHPVAAAVGGGMLAEIGIKAAIGLISYHSIKRPMHWLGDKAFGLDKETAHDRIISIARDREQGKIISQEQTLGAFAVANQQLGRFIESEYGAEYDKLHLEDKQRATRDLSKLIPLERITSDINSGKVNVAELAFSVEGQISGVEHAPTKPEKRGFISVMVDKIRDAVGLAKKESVQTERRTAVVVSDVPVVIEERSAGEKSFVERLGRGKHDTAMGHVERLEQRSRIEGNLTIH